MRDQGADFVLGLVLGALLGAAVMILFAPDEGAKTRQHMINQGVALRRRALETADEVSYQIKERTQDALALASKPFTKRKRGLARLRFW
jgi:gas vesicle protein